jgi:hypothetical protein
VRRRVVKASVPRCRSVQALALAMTLASYSSPAAADPAPRPRPKIELAVGMGASLDDAGLGTSGVQPIPAFFVMGGFGDGPIGFDLGLFANSATGRFRSPDVPLDRLALDGMLVIRPAAHLVADGARYDLRIERTAAIDVGLGFERTSRIVRSPEAVDRFGVRVGAHVDVPLTSARETSELRLRLAVRRFVGASTKSFPGGDPAPDTRGEVFAALAAVF